MPRPIAALAVRALLALAVITAVPRPAVAAPPPPPATKPSPAKPSPAKPTLPPQLPAAIASFVDEDTVWVAVVDVAAVDPDAIVAWSVAFLKSGRTPADDVDGARAALQSLAQPARNWALSFGRAGGRYLVVVGSTDARVPALVLAPLEGRANPAALADLLKSPFGLPLPGAAPTGRPAPPPAGAPPAKGAAAPAAAGYAVERVGSALVLGTPAALKKARDVAAKPTRPPRPELTAGLTDVAAVGEIGGGVRVALAMTDEARELVRSIGPTLPAELGGEPTAVVTDKLKSATSPSICQPPRQRGRAAGRPAAAPGRPVRLTVRGADPDAAARLHNVLVALFRTAANDGALATHPDKDAVLKLLDPVVAGDRVTVALGQPELTAAAGVLGPLALAARAKAARAKSATNLSLVASAIRNATLEAGGRPPRSIEDPLVLKFLGDTPAGAKAVLTDPLHPDRGLGYVYVRPAGLPADPAATILVYEAYDRWPAAGIQVVSVLGTVGEVKTEADLKARLRAAGGR